MNDATITSVRHPGGLALAVSIGTRAESPGFGAMSAEYPIGPELSIVLAGKHPPRWEYGSPDDIGDSPLGPMPMLYLYDMHRIDRLAVELLGEEASLRELRLRGTAGGFAFEVLATARFGGETDYAPSVPLGWWQGHFARPATIGWPTGTPLDETLWRRTSEFRRLMRVCFARPLPSPAPAPPEWRIATLARRLGLIRSPRPAAAPPPPPTISERQAQLLLAALVEYYLADVTPNGSPDEFREVARLIERYADGSETAADRIATAPIIGRACLNETELLLNDYSPSSARTLLQFAHLDPGVGRHMPIQWLFPERCPVGCDLLKDILGNPFRPVRFDPGWRTEAVSSLAEGVYRERAFDRLPILADALEEAGCAEEAVLAHCRGDDPHVRGCWVIEGLRGLDRSAEPRPFVRRV